MPVHRETGETGATPLVLKDPAMAILLDPSAVAGGYRVDVLRGARRPCRSRPG